MKEYYEKLNLGKGSAFVKSRLSRLVVLGRRSHWLCRVVRVGVLAPSVTACFALTGHKGGEFDPEKFSVDKVNKELRKG